MGRVPKSTNCVICALKLFFFHGNLTLNLLQYQCPHKSPHVFASSVTLSPIRGIVNIIIIFAFVYVLIEDGLEIIQGHLTKMRLLLGMIRFFEIISAVIVLLVSQIQQGVKIKEFTGLVRIDEHLSVYGAKVFVPEKCAQGVRGYFLLLYGVLAPYIIVTVIELYLLFHREEDRLYSEMSRKIIAEVCQSIIGSMVVSYACLCLFYQRVYETCFARIMEVLDCRVVASQGVALYHNEDFNTDREYCTMHNVRDLLQRLNRLYLAIHSNMNFMVKFVDPTFVVWWTALCVVLIINVYTVVAFLFKDEFPLESYHLIMLLKHLLSFTTVYLLLHQAHNLRNVSDDITSFLFRYPISKLTPSEAAQIEILLTTLHTQKPILKASGIFTIGTRLMASITGTVITYVLVALQFHASWSQD